MYGRFTKSEIYQLGLRKSAMNAGQCSRRIIHNKDLAAATGSATTPQISSLPTTVIPIILALPPDAAPVWYAKR
jgi:hypothetical protein